MNSYIFSASLKCLRNDYPGKHGDCKLFKNIRDLCQGFIQLPVESESLLKGQNKEYNDV